MKKNILSLAIIITSITALAQRDANLYFLPTVQSTKMNPAFIPKTGTVLGLTGLSGGGFDLTNAFKLSDLTKKHPTYADSLQLDFKGLADKLETTGNALNTVTDIDLFRIGFRMGLKKKTMVTINVTEKILFGMNYPKSLFEFLGSGTDPQNFTNVSLSGIKMDFTHYREWGFTFAREVNEKLSVGLGMKLLYGKGNMHTERTDISIQTGVNSPATISNNTLINTSGFGTLDEDVVAYTQIAENTGFALDIGGTYKVNEKIEASLSILDIGAGINWTTNNRTVSADSSYTFNGIDFTDSTQQLSTYIDSLVGVLNFDTAEVKVAYKTSLPTRINLAGNYTINEKFKAGALLNMSIGDETKTAFSMVGQYKVSHVFSASLSYGIYNGTYANFGLGFVLNGGPFQLYFGTDNITSFNLVGSKNANLRFGTNFQFGRTDKGPKKVKETTTTMN